MMNRPLQGLRLVVSGYELEQREHRGIAVFSKGLLKALKTAGAEVWLLTEIEAPMQDILTAKLPKTVQSRIRSARVLDSLNSGERIGNNSGHLKLLLHRLPLVGDVLKLRLTAKRVKHKLFPRKLIPAKALKILPRTELNHSPYERCERLSYLADIDGLICADNCFADSLLLAKSRHPKPLRIDLRGFDGFITTSPLNVRPLNTKMFVQTVHDLIPIDYQRTKDHLPCFTIRLQAAAPAKRLFISKDAKQQYNLVILPMLKGFNPADRVIVQSPSLEFPGDALDWEARTQQIRIRPSDQSQLHALAPFSYFLFNSSVVPHKNLLFALKAFVESGVESMGYLFCITGQTQSDDYSDAVSNVVANNKSVIFTGYVDEATKRHLYLNALALLSPSLIEGFGIPVLDAACLGLTTIASPLGSHQEIQALHDFREHVLLCSTLNTSVWASAMRLVSLRMRQTLEPLTKDHQRNHWNRIRHERIQRYRSFKHIIDEAFRETICELITNNNGTGSPNDECHPAKLSN